VDDQEFMNEMQTALAGGRWHDQIIRLKYSHTLGVGHRDVVEDVAQDSFLGVYRPSARPRMLS